MKLGTQSQLTLPTTVLPASLARRYAELATREKPLLITSLEKFQLHAAIAVPAGMKLGAPPEVNLETPFGRYRWKAWQQDGKVMIDESLLLPPQRVAPAGYAAFSEFCNQVDAAQSAAMQLSR